MLTEFWFFLTFLNLISDDIGAFLFTLTGQNTSHLHTGAHQDPTPTLASSPQKKEKHRMDCVCWQMVPVPLYQSINHSPPGLHEENHFISAQRCYWLSAGNYQERRMHGVAVTWLSQTLNDIRDRFAYLKFKEKQKRTRKKTAWTYFPLSFMPSCTQIQQQDGCKKSCENKEVTNLKINWFRVSWA